MTWAATYTNVTFLSATDWIAGETNAGAGFTFQASVILCKTSGGGPYYGNAPLKLDSAADQKLILQGSGSPYIDWRSADGSARYGYQQFASTFGLLDCIGGSFVIRINGADRAIVANTGLLAGTDNTLTCGGASNRWSTVYAGTGSINTSDEREKDQLGAIPDDWLDAWGDVAWCRFKFRGAVAAKGELARWHIGAAAQAVRRAFSARKLDALAIGLLCHDAWELEDAIEEERDESGEILVAGRAEIAAGDRWGLRYDECFALEAAWQRRELDRLAARLALLDGGG